MNIGVGGLGVRVGVKIRAGVGVRIGLGVGVRIGVGVGVEILGKDRGRARDTW